MPIATLQQQFQTDTGPLVDTVKASAAFGPIEQAAGDSARLLSADRWPSSVSRDVTDLVAAFNVVAQSGNDYHALGAGLDKLKTSYDRVAGDLKLPQPFIS